MKKLKKTEGVSTVEFSLLLPLLVTVLLAIVQVVIYLQSSTATQYAAFAAARAYQVYGDRTLGEIQYKNLRESPYTNREQPIAEAAAEKVIFESLLWEHPRIRAEGSYPTTTRTYEDGIDLARDGVSSDRTQGAVRVNMRTGLGVEVTYCMPIVFPMVDILFSAAKKEYPCKNSRMSHHYSGVAIVQKAQFGREPTEL